MFAIFKILIGGHKWLFISPLIAFIAACGREFSLGVSIGVLASLAAYKFIHKIFKIEYNLNYRISRILLIIAGGVAGYGFARWFIPNNHSFEWSIKATLIDTFYTNLNIINLPYPFYAGLGTFLLIIVANLLNANLRTKYFKKLSAVEHFTLLYIFAFVAIVIALIAGPDRDRYLIWYFPLFGYFAIVGAENIASETNWNKLFFIFLLVVTVSWTRCYVPALPHTVFNKNFPTQIKTDYNPKFYAGIPFFSRYRLPLKQFIVVPDSTTPMDLGTQMEIAYFASTQTLDKVGLSHMPLVYKHHANYIPVPLGIPTNQYELLTSTPTWGNFRVRAAILVQWVLLQLGLAVLIRRKFKRST
jgi:hypothetical protein